MIARKVQQQHSKHIHEMPGNLWMCLLVVPIVCVAAEKENNIEITHQRTNRKLVKERRMKKKITLQKSALSKIYSKLEKKTKMDESVHVCFFPIMSIRKSKRMNFFFSTEIFFYRK